MRDKIEEILQKNNSKYMRNVESELYSAEEIELLIKKEVLKGKIEVAKNSLQKLNPSNNSKLIVYLWDVIEHSEQQIKQLKMKCKICNVSMFDKALSRTNPTGQKDAGWMCQDCIKSNEPELYKNLKNDGALKITNDIFNAINNI